MIADFLPGPQEFAANYAMGKAQLVHASIVADLETPVSAMLKLADGKPMSFLMESVEGGDIRGRYSFIGFRPDLVWRCRDGKAEINRDPLAEPDSFAPLEGAALDTLRDLIAESEIEMPEGLPPMAAGLVGFLGYDMIREIEDIPAGNPDMLDLPDGIMMRPTIICVFDNIQHTITIVTPVHPRGGVSSDAAYAAARERLADVLMDLGRSLPFRRESASAMDLPDPISNTGQQRYEQMVEKAKEYILAGDIFQVVPSHRFTQDFALPPFSYYRTLRRVNPSPFLFYLDFGAFHVVGSSPEILVRVRDNTVTIRPIAGTRKRGATREEDAELAADLLGDPKELAEHLMLLDLGRNDVGRVSKTGTVTVTEHMKIENYSHVMHIVSNVEGELKDDEFDAVDALFAGFPAGTVSGAPKVRAMEIIEELEVAKRGIYGGCVGYFGAGGDMDSCICLRTAVLKDGKLHVQAGGGVVADSDPTAEWEETCNKARALLRAAEETAERARQ
ncbi:MAG: anthranilate synthase component I [Alphaproteobacteria bacterium]